MTSSQEMKSITLFVISVAVLVLLTLFESAFSGLSTSIERVISFVFLVIPGLVGIIFGGLGLIKKEPRKWIALIGVLLNGLFAAFMTFVLLFAG